MITFQEEFFVDVIDDLEELLEPNHSEVEPYQDKVSLNPDYSIYSTLSDNGMLKIVTARDDENLVGYCVTLVAPSLHYKGSVSAVCDTIYVVPDKRGGWVSKGLLSKTEELLRKDSVDHLFVHMKHYKKFESVLEDLNYDFLELVYSKYIGD